MDTTYDKLVAEERKAVDELKTNKKRKLNELQIEFEAIEKLYLEKRKDYINSKDTIELEYQQKKGKVYDEYSKKLDNLEKQDGVQVANKNLIVITKYFDPNSYIHNERKERIASFAGYDTIHSCSNKELLLAMSKLIDGFIRQHILRNLSEIQILLNTVGTSEIIFEHFKDANRNILMYDTQNGKVSVALKYFLEHPITQRNIIKKLMTLLYGFTIHVIFTDYGLIIHSL